MKRVKLKSLTRGDSSGVQGPKSSSRTGRTPTGDRETLRVYEKLREDGVTPTVPTLLSALKACIGLKDVEAGRRVHFHVTEIRLETHTHVANTLVDMYAKCGCMGEARGVFESMRQRSVVSWNAVIMGYASNGEGGLALELFTRMQREGFAPDARIFIAALKACASLAAGEEAKQVCERYVKTECVSKGRALHTELAKRGYEEDMFVASILVDVYAKCGSMEEARAVFEKMVRHDVVSWTAVILGYAESGEGEVALELFTRMQDEGFKPDSRIFLAALKACGSVAVKEEGAGWKGRWLEKGMEIHKQVVNSGYESNVFVAGSLVDMYAKCGNMEESRRVFDRLQQRNVVLWNSMIMAYAQSGREEEAWSTFERMKAEGQVPDSRTFVVALTACAGLAAKEEGRELGCKVVKVASLEKGRALHKEALVGRHERDIFVANSLLDMYAKCGSMMDARKVFDNMKTLTLVSWNVMITGYAQNSDEEVALELFSRMKKQGFVPDARHYVAALRACGGLAALETGRQIHREITDTGYNKVLLVTNSLIHFYGRCGSMADAQRIFHDARTKELATWNALIAGYTHQGDTGQVFELFEKMKRDRIQPNGITFLLVLNSCTHAGLVEKGKEVFSELASVLPPTREHFTCMVDLLARANRLDEALEMITSMPYKPDSTLWRAVLGACQKWDNVRVGTIAFESLQRLGHVEATGYVLMGNIYARNT